MMNPVAKRVLKAVKVRLKDAERAKRFLLSENVLSHEYAPLKKKEFILFAISRDASVVLPFEHEITRARFQPNKSKPTALEFPFDLIGDVALIDAESIGKAGEAARILLETNPRICCVALKSAFSGKYRVRRLRVLVGRRDTETVHRESGCSFAVDPALVYFSSRLSFERERIAVQVKEGERVLVLFAGVGPFAIIGSKKQPLAHFVAVELNPNAIPFLEKNIEANKVIGRVKAVRADAAKFCAKPVNCGAFDRVVMPLPHSAHEFLDGALAVLKRGGVVHFYSFGQRRDVERNTLDAFSKPSSLVRAACAKAGRKCRIISKRAVLHYSPFEDEVVLDVIVG